MDSKRNCKSKEIIVFDFCKTIVNIESADDFCIFALKSQKKTLLYIFSKIINSFLIKKILLSLDVNIKKLLLSLLKGIPKNHLKKIGKKYSEIIKQDYLNSEIFKKFLSANEQDKEILVISAGYSIYLKPFFSKYECSIIANDFLYTDGIFTGKIIKKDCYGEEKLLRLREHFSELSKIVIEDCYSDSMSDLPIFNISKNKFFVNKNNIKRL